MTIKVRFAPSPTGHLHIGNARTALINWLFAKKNNGHFMLRMDDTDRDRSREDFANSIRADLNWLGLNYHSFAKQSDRFARYQEVVNSLIENGRLYPCYETAEELEFKKKRQLARGEPPFYDRAALKLTEIEKKNLENNGVKPHWRFHLLPEKIHWQDLIRGDVDFHGSHLGDPILVKADGSYLYSLTSVIDDLDFGITHILRGEDHVTNTAVQIQLFKAISGANTVDMVFGHTSWLTDEKGQGLSKRLGSLGLHSFKEQGIEPMAINSLLARLGTSLPVEATLTLEELANNFDIKTFSRTPPRFNERELLQLNHKIFQIMPYSTLIERLQDLDLPVSTFSNPSLENIWPLIREEINFLADIKLWQAIFVGDIDSVTLDSITLDIDDMSLINQANLTLDDFLKNSSNESNQGESDPGDIKQGSLDQRWKDWLDNLKQITGKKGKALLMPLRLVLTGLSHGPEITKMLPLIGYQRVKKRLLACLKQ